MKVVYKKPIELQLQDAIDVAYIQGKKIDRIELNAAEWDEFKTYLRRILSSKVDAEFMFDGGFTAFKGVHIVAAPK